MYTRIQGINLICPWPGLPAGLVVGTVSMALDMLIVGKYTNIIGEHPLQKQNLVVRTQLGVH